MAKSGESNNSKINEGIRAKNSLGVLWQLEPRMMFDGAGISTASEVIDTTLLTQDQSGISRINTKEISFGETNGQLIDVNSPAQTDSRNQSLQNNSLEGYLANYKIPRGPINEIVFVDTSIADYETILAGIDSNAQVVLLDRDRDGVEQIASYLSQHRSMDAIHIISHGRSGSLQLGIGTLNAESMSGQYSDELAMIQRSLSDTADILVYGCDFAEGQAGQEAVTLLSQLTGADVAASIDATGYAGLGGDWILETQTGYVEAQVAVSDGVQADWVGLLDISTGLIGDWTFDTNANDSSGNNYNGTLTNGAVIDTNDATDIVGGAKLSLDGVNDYVELSAHSANLAGLTQGTIAGWINTTSTFETIFSISDTADTGSSAALFLGASGYLTYEVMENGVLQLAVFRSSATINDGNWHHVAVTVGGSGNSLYVDGVLATAGQLTYDVGNATTQRFFSSVTSLDSMAIGRNQGSGGGTWYTTGLIDDVRVYNRVLTEGDIAQLYATSNDAPTITNLSGDSLSYNEGTGAVVIEQGANALVADTDSANFDTGTLTISIPSGGDSAEDVLNIRNQGTGAGQIGVNGSNVTYGGVTIGTFTGGSNGSNLVIIFNSNATPTAVTALVKNIAYENTDAAAPTTGARTVRYVLTDGDGGTSANYDTIVTVSAVNDAPVLTLGALMNGSFESGAAGWTGNTGVEIGNVPSSYGIPAPPDGTYFVEVEGSNMPGVQSYIEQTFTTVVGQTYVVSLSAITRMDVNVQDRGAFSINGVEIGQFTTDTSWKDYAVSFTATSTSSTLQIISKGSLSGSAPLASDGGGLIIDHVQVVPVPVQTAVAYTEGGAPAVLAGTARVFDAELSALNTFNGATLTLARNGGANAEDVFSGSGTLSLASGNVVVSGTTIGTYTNSSGTLQLTLNASATNTLVNSAMQQIAYSNSSDAPPASAQINWTFNDGNSGSQGSGGALTATGSTTVTITAVNDAPTFGAGDGKLTTNFGVSDDQGTSMTVQADGKVLVAGRSWNGSNYDFALVRYNTDGTLDTSFSGDGTLTTAIGSGDDYGQSIAVQADGKILVTGYGWNGSTYDFALVRYNTDGTLDTSFSGDGKLTTDFGASSDYGYSVTVQADGKILVAGQSNVGGAYDFALTRYNSDGTLDTSFSGDGKLTTDFGVSDDYGTSMTVQADGKILVAGYSWNGSTFDVALVRYNNNGTLDTSFSGDGMLTTDFGASSDYGYSVTVQADGKILVAGQSNVGGTYDFALVRYNTDGTLDTSFSGDGKLTTNFGSSYNYGASVTVQADGKILVGGTSWNGSNYDFALVRYNSDGTLDTSFSGDGELTTAIGSESEYGASVTVQADGKILVAGQSWNGSNYDFALVRYSNDGTLDRTFDSVPANTLNGTPTFTEGGVAVVLDADVQIFDAELSALNNFNGATLTLARNGGANAQDVFSGSGTLSLTSGNVVVSGTTIGTYTNSGGTLAFTFNSNATQTLVNSAMRQITYSNSSDAPPASAQINWTLNDGNSGSQGSGGALTATGSTTITITAVNDAPTLTNLSGDSVSYSEGAGAVVIEQGANALVADIDSSNFDTGTLTISIRSGGDSAEDVLSIRNQGTGAGQIGVSGSNVTYGGVTIGTFTGGSNGSNLVITLNSSATPTVVTALVKNITYENTDTAALTTGARTVRYVLTDGDGGTSANYDTTVTVSAVNDAPTFSVGDGKATTSFGSGWEFGKETILQPDGKILVAGYSDSSGSDDFSLARYNVDGTLDTSFGGGDGIALAGIVGRAETAVLQADGKIVLSGYTTNGGYQVCLVRFNTNGTLDTSFGGGDGIASSGVYGSAKDIGLQTDGKFLVAADLSNNNFNLMRFNSDGSLDTGFGGGPGYVSTDFVGGSDRADSLTIQSDGKVLLAGFGFNGTSFDFALVRYNTDGSLDTSFNGTGKVLTNFGGNSSDTGNEVRVQADGKIVVAGWSDTGGTNDLAIVRYNANGTLDSGFGTGGKVTINLGGSDFAEGLTIQADGKLLVTGTAGINGNDFGLVRLNTDGSLDTTFSGDGIVTTDYTASSDDRAYSVVVQSDGHIVVSGTSRVSAGDYNYAFTRYTSTGALDTTLDPVNTLNGAPTYTEGGSPVVLDTDVSIFDAELSALNNFSGATLTLARNGGANPEDAFSATGTLSLSSGNLIVSGTTIGTYTNSGGTLAVTFNSNATQALVNSAMQQIAYSNSSDAPPASTQINWTFSDNNSGSQGSGGALTATGSTTVTITAVNDAPTITNLSGDSLSYNEGAGAVVIEQGANALVADVDSANFDTGTLTISIPSGGDSAEDVLSIRNQGTGAGQIGVSGSNVTYGGVTIGTFTGGSNGTSLVITLNSSATPTAVTALVKNITYENTDAVSPTTGARTVRYVLSDGDGGTSANYDATVTVTAVNDAPAFSNLNGTPTFTEGGAAVVLDANVQIFDAELSALNNFNGATLTLARNGGANAEDVFSGSGTLSLTSGNVVVSGTTIGTYTNSGGTLQFTLNASATNTLVNSAMQQIAYSNSSDAPPASAQINWTFSDGNSGGQGSGGALTATGSTTVTITEVNDAPTITNLSGDSLSYNEGAGAVVIEQGANALVADIDSSNFDTGTLTVSIPSGGDSAEDVLSIRNQGTGAGQIGVSGSSVTYGGVTIGTFIGGSTGTNLVITLNSSATPTAVTALVKNITYENTDTAAPTTGARTVRYVLSDGDGGTSANYDATVTVTAVNDAPAFSNLNGTPTFTEGGAAVVLDANVQIFDAELSALNNFNGATLTLARNGGANAEDVFSGSGTLSLTSGNVVVSGTTIGTYTNSGGTLQFTLNASATNTLVNSAMQQIAYSNSSDAPPASAQINWTFSDGNSGGQGSGGALTATGSTTVTITEVNDAPTITNLSGDSLSYNEGAGAVVIEQGANALVADIDSSNFDTGTLTVSIPSGGDSAEDVLSIRNQGTGAGQIGVSGSSVTYGGVTIGTFIGGSTGTNLVITLNSSATPTAVTALVKNITYENTDTAAPTTGARTVHYVLSDGDGGTSANYNTTVTVSAVNDAPTMTNLSGDSLSYSEGAGAVVIEQGANVLVTDPDSANFDTGTLTVSVPTGGDSAEDVLSIQNQGTGVGQIGVSSSTVTYESVSIGTFTGGSNGSNLVITFNNSATPTAITALVKHITYENTDTNAPTTGARTVRYVLTDGDGGTSANYDTTVTVIAANDAPVNTVPGAQMVTENMVLAIGGISIADVDGNLNTVQLTVGNGILNVTLSGAASISAGSNGSNTLTLSGSQIDINATLTSLSYQGDIGFIGSDTLTITSTDSLAATDIDTVNINVTAGNVAPINTVPGAQTAAENTSFSINGISINDANGDLSTVELTVAQGSLTVLLSGGATISAGSNGSNTLTLSGSQVDINATLASLSYQGDIGFIGSDTLTITSTDSLAATDIDTVNINVTAGNVAPINTVPGAQTAAENTSFSINGISINDANGDLSTVELTVAQGSLTVLLSGGATISAGSNGSNTLTLSGSQVDINATLTSLSYQGD
ncbi:MAG: DUF4347 domain-containing protein, partial [Nitrosomonas sp.]|nr:DUF4347 domain-containing protein [Nitrosomonas sp.]